MAQATFIKVAGWIFGIIAVLHALRLLMGWEVIIGGLALPLWLSIFPVVLGGYLAYQATKM